MRKLTNDEIECRVSQVGDGWCSLLLYKTARVDRAILDEEYGPFNWQNDFRVINGNLYCGIGVYDEKKQQWIWKWDCGTESNTEKEKGEASDSFKRAGFRWGIGVELYYSPKIFLNVETFQKDGKFFLKNKKSRFCVSKIGYDGFEISILEIKNEKNEIVFSYKTPAEKAKQARSENKASFEERFAKAYKIFQNPDLKWSYNLKESFLRLMTEAEKRKYEDEKQKEMWDIFQKLPKDEMPTFEVPNL